MAYRNERGLHKRKCSRCEKAIISIYPEDAIFPVYCYQCWWSDNWDPLSYGISFDETKPFFEQVKELKNKVPRLQTANSAYSRLINSDYTNSAIDLKNCYLIFAAIINEDCYYANYIRDSKTCMDMLNCIKSEQSYDCFDITGCFNLSFSQSCMDCRDSSFLYDCRNCSNCIGCVGLRNQQYHIFNKKYSKEEFEKEKEKLQLYTYRGIEAMRKRFNDFILGFPRKYYHGFQNNNFTGDYVWHSEGVRDVFYVAEARNVKHTFWCYGAEDVYDYIAWGDAELTYEAVECGDKVYGCKFSHQSWSEARNLEYCDFCLTSADSFGCVSLRNKQYCILNKQYSKEEYEALKKQIIEHMNVVPYVDTEGREYRYGEFFPIEMSPYNYNDTIAQEHFPLTEEAAKNYGYKWEIEQKKDYGITRSSNELPETIRETADAILDEIIGCAHEGKCHERCTVAFKLTEFELQFYQNHNIPLPRLCHNCRHYRRVMQRNPVKLWHRQCMCDYNIYRNSVSHSHHEQGRCPNEFETSYATDRKEIVYCETCYQAEVA
jgi:hypothetical protein